MLIVRPRKIVLFMLLIITIIGQLLGQHQTIFLIISIISTIAFFAFAGEERRYYLILFLVPNIRIYDELGITFIVNILMLIPFFQQIAERMRIPKNEAIIAAILAIIELTNALIFKDSLFLVVANISNILLLLYCICLFYSPNTMLTSVNAAYYLGAGLLSSFIIYMINNTSYLGKFFTTIGAGRYFPGYTGDPNYYAFYSCIALSIILLDPKEKSYIDYFFVVSLSTIAFLTASKMAFLLLIFIFLSASLINLRHIITKKNQRFIRRILLLLLAVSLVFHKYIGIFIKYMAKRAGLGGDSIDISVLTTGRSTIAINYLGFIRKDLRGLLFGYGLEYNKHISSLTSLITHSAHNTFLDVFLAWGLFGFFFLLLLFAIWILHCRYLWGIPQKFFYYIPAIVLLLGFFALSSLNASMCWPIVTIVILFARPRLKSNSLKHGFIQKK